MTEHRTYTAKEVVKLTGIPHNTLNSWHARGLLRPLFGANGPNAPTAGVARRYGVRELFELLVIAHCSNDGYQPRVAIEMGQWAGNYTPRLDGDYSHNTSLVLVGHSIGDQTDPAFQTQMRYRMDDSEFGADFMPRVRERHGNCSVLILPLSKLQARLVEALRASAA